MTHGYIIKIADDCYRVLARHCGVCDTGRFDFVVSFPVCTPAAPVRRSGPPPLMIKLVGNALRVARHPPLTLPRQPGDSLGIVQPSAPAEVPTQSSVNCSHNEVST